MKTKYRNAIINPTRDEILGKVPIAFDMDSVLNRMGHEIGVHIANHFGCTFEQARVREDGYEKFHFMPPGVEYKDIIPVVDDFVINKSIGLLASPYMRDVMYYVHWATKKPITVVTYRAKEALDVTDAWLAINLRGIPFDLYIQHGVPKVETLSLLCAEAFIDDRYKTVKSLVGAINYPILYRQAWNSNRPDYNGMIPANDLRDIIPIVNTLTGRVPTEWPLYIPYPES